MLSKYYRSSYRIRLSIPHTAQSSQSYPKSCITHPNPAIHHASIPNFSSTNVSQRFYSDFSALNLHAKLCEALRSTGFTSPTLIQTQSIQAILQGHNVLTTAQTGSGKTLAYLLPIIHQLLLEQLPDRSATIARPRALILAPSRELAVQIGLVAKSLSHIAKFSTCIIVNGDRKKHQQAKLSRPIDIVIGTPGRVAHCLDKNDFYLSRVSTLVLDEADALLNPKLGFQTELSAVVDPIRASCEKRGKVLQSILVAATADERIRQLWSKDFQSLFFATDSKVFQIPSHIKEAFIRVTPETRHVVLRQVLGEASKEKVMIFCNTIASCRAAQHMLREHDFKAICLHKEMPKAVRKEAIDAFASSVSHILVSTDIAARGLDFRDVHHVIMLDFPRSLTDYVHRAGRTGRTGAVGRVTSFVTKGDSKVMDIVKRNASGKSRNSKNSEVREERYRPKRNVAKEAQGIQRGQVRRFRCRREVPKRKSAFKSQSKR